MIFLSSAISLVCSTLASLVSFTFRTLPFNGYTPKNFRCSWLRPDNAIALAESPSVRMSVHLADSFVPAWTASSSLGMPVILDCFLPSVLLFSLASLADCASSSFGTIASLVTIFLSVSSDSRNPEPNDPDLVVSVSLVWLVKLGFSIIAVTNTARLSRTMLGLTLTFFLVSRYSTM